MRHGKSFRSVDLKFLCHHLSRCARPRVVLAHFPFLPVWFSTSRLPGVRLLTHLAWIGHHLLDARPIFLIQPAPLSRLSSPGCHSSSSQLLSPAWLALTACSAPYSQAAHPPRSPLSVLHPCCSPLCASPPHCSPSCAAHSLRSQSRAASSAAQKSSVNRHCSSSHSSTFRLCSERQSSHRRSSSSHSDSSHSSSVLRELWSLPSSCHRSPVRSD